MLLLKTAQTGHTGHICPLVASSCFTLGPASNNALATEVNDASFTYSLKYSQVILIIITHHIHAAHPGLSIASGHGSLFLGLTLAITRLRQQTTWSSLSPLDQTYPWCRGWWKTVSVSQDSLWRGARIPLLKPQSLLNVCGLGLTSHHLKQSKWVILAPRAWQYSTDRDPEVFFWATLCHWNVSSTNSLSSASFTTVNQIIVIVTEASTLAQLLRAWSWTSWSLTEAQLASDARRQHGLSWVRGALWSRFRSSSSDHRVVHHPIPIPSFYPAARMEVKLSCSPALAQTAGRPSLQAADCRVSPVDPRWPPTPGQIFAAPTRH